MGSVVTWGKVDASLTGSSSSLSGVVEIFSTNYAFAALTSSGTVACWGTSDYYMYNDNGGACDSSDLYPSGSTLESVSTIFSNYYAFAALKADNTVVAWGNQVDGLQSLTSVTQIFSNYYAFAALHTDGTVSAFGSSYQGATLPLSPSGSFNIGLMATIGIEIRRKC